MPKARPPVLLLAPALVHHFSIVTFGFYQSTIFAAALLIVLPFFYANLQKMTTVCFLGFRIFSTVA